MTMCKGVFPKESVMVGSAPLESKTETQEVLPFRTASCNAVEFATFFALTGQPCSIKCLTKPRYPFDEAT